MKRKSKKFLALFVVKIVNIIYLCVKLLNFMFIELMLAHVVTLALAVKIDLASNAAVLLNRNRSFRWVILQPHVHT